MIINSTDYEINYPLNAGWNINVTRKPLSSGFYDIIDKGYDNDEVLSRLTFHGTQSHLQGLIDLLKVNRTRNCSFNSKEQIFGTHVQYPSMDLKFSNISQLRRSNFNFYTFTAVVRPNLVPTLRGDITPSLDNLNYPSSYPTGEKWLDEKTNISSYGESFNSYRSTVAQCIFDFDLSEDVSAEAMAYFTSSVRGDGFTLPTDWAGLNPFGEKTYTHAILLDLAFNKRKIHQHTLTVTLQGYNNG